MIFSLIPIGSHGASQAASTKASDIMVPSDEHGLRVQFFGSTWGLSGFWGKTDLIGTTRTKNAYYDFIGASDALTVERSVFKRTRMDGFIMPEYSERYTFKTNADDDLKLWINDKLVINYGFGVDIELEAGDKYKIELELQQGYHDEIEIKWSSESQDEEVIPNSRLFAPDTAEGIPGNSIIKGYINPSQDIDRDGIPDAWEINGYTVVEGVIMPFDEELHTVKYVTNPNEKSTDGDPYSDFMEVTGIGMDQSVKAPGNNPLVPAYPKIEFVPTSVDVVPSKTNSTDKSVNNGLSTTQNVTSVNLNTDTTGGYRKENTDSRLEIGSKYSANSLSGEAYVGTYYKMDQSGGVTWNSRNAATNEAKKIQGNKYSESTKYTDIDTTVVDTTNYAYLTVNGYYRNLGTATAYDVRPHLSLRIAGEEKVDLPELGEDGEGSKNNSTDITVRSFEVTSNQRPKLIGPDVNYPANGNIALSLTESGSSVAPEDIVLNKAQAEKLQLGYPFKVNGTYRSYVASDKKNSEDRWSYYINKIDKRSATITLALPNQVPIERKIYAGNDKQKMNLLDALKVLFNAESKESNGRTNLVIDGEEITPNLYSEWGIRVQGKQGEASGKAPLDKFIAGLSGATGYEDIILQPETNIYIYKKDNAAKASILSSYYNPNDNKIYAVVIPGTEQTKEVKAKIKDETEKELTLKKVEGENFKFVSQPVYNISTTYNNELIAVSESQQESKAKIYIDNEYLKSRARNGLNYVKFPNNLNKRPFTDRDSLSAVKSYVEKNKDHKYYAITIGENKRYNFGINQDSMRIKIGNTTIVNQAQARVAKTTEVLGNYELTTNNMAYNKFNVITVDRRYPNRIYGKWPHTNIYIGNAFRGIYSRWMPDGVTTRYQVRVKSDEGTSSLITLYTREGIDIYNVKDKFPISKEWKKNPLLLYYDLYQYYTSNPAVHTQSAIVSREDLLSYLNTDDGFWNSNGLVINGMYSQAKEGQVFIPFFNEYQRASGGLSELTIRTMHGQKPDAVMMSIRKPGKDPGTVTVGDTQVELNTGDWSDYHEDLIIADAKANGNIKLDIPSKKEIDYQVLGYFIDKSKLLNDQKYLQYWVPENSYKRTIFPEFGKASTNLFTVKASNINVNGYPVKPKAFMLKVDTKGLGTDGLKLTINGRDYRMDVGHKVQSSRFNPIDHTAYIMVQAGQDNPYVLNTSVDTMTDENNATPGQIEFEVVGFFYENLY